MLVCAWFRSSRKRWYVTHEGRQIPLDITDPNDQVGADAAAKRLIDQLTAGIAAKLVIPEKAIGPTVAEAVATFLAAGQKRVVLDKLDHETLVKYRRSLTYLTEDFGNRPIASLTADELETWAASQGWAPSTQNHHLAVIQALLGSSGLSVKVHRPPMESRGADTALTEEQFAAVLVALRPRPSIKADLPELLQVLRETGARPQEIALLKCDGVDWGNSVARIRKHKTRRHGIVRVVHFTAAAMAILNAQKERHKDGYLFRTKDGNPYSGNVIVRRLRHVSDRLGFRVIAYGLGRHSFATRALESGVPDVIVAALLGQRGTAMLHKHYSHVGENARALKDAAEKVSRGKAG